MPELKHGLVRYRKVNELDDEAIEVDKMPFTKRWPYRCEDEFRVIWQGKCKDAFFEVPIDLKLIRKITLNQRMPHNNLGRRDYRRPKNVMLLPDSPTRDAPS